MLQPECTWYCHNINTLYRCSLASSGVVLGEGGGPVQTQEKHSNRQSSYMYEYRTSILILTTTMDGNLRTVSHSNLWMNVFYAWWY